MSAPIGGDAGVPPRAGRPALRRQLAVAYGVVVLAAAGLALGAYFLFVRGGSTSWSHWKPQSTVVATAASQIAAHVAPRYRLRDGSQMAKVVSKDPRALLAITYEVSPTQASGVLATPTPDNSVQYQLTGSGKNGEIKDGAGSASQSFLARQEALELALYSFKYLPGVQSVAVFLPPKPGQLDRGYRFVQLFRRQQLAGQLTKPLADSVPQTPPPPPQGLSASERTRIAAQTTPSLYVWATFPLWNQRQFILRLARP
jgi:hypothetical protein